MAAIRTVLFDLDGTLIDSIQLILNSYHHTLDTHGFPPRSDVEWLVGIGVPLRLQLARWARSPAELDAMVATYRKHNLEHHDGMVRAYPGVVEAVRSIKATGRPMGIVTSKNRDGTRRGLRLTGIETAFDVLVCADDVVNPKPHREPVDRAVALLEADPATTIYVGDSPHDMHCGRSAGVLTVAALWGPFARQDLEPTGPDFWVESPGEVLSLLNSAGGG